MFNRNSQYRKAISIKHRKYYISLKEMKKYTPYSIEKFVILYNIPIMTLQRKGINYIIFLPEKYNNYKIDTNKNFYFEYFGDSIINSNLEFIIYEIKEIKNVSK